MKNRIALFSIASIIVIVVALFMFFNHRQMDTGDAQDTDDRISWARDILAKNDPEDDQILTAINILRAQDGRDDYDALIKVVDDNSNGEFSNYALLSLGEMIEDSVSGEPLWVADLRYNKEYDAYKKTVYHYLETGDFVRYDTEKSVSPNKAIQTDASGAADF